MAKQTKFSELKRVFDVLHGPKGCLWDRKQTHKTLVKYLREESREFIETVNKNSCRHMKEELGDLLLQVMFHSQIAKKNGRFDIEGVIDGLIKKLKRRHPHVFGTVKVQSVGEIIENWDRIKAREKSRARSGK